MCVSFSYVCMRLFVEYLGVNARVLVGLWAGVNDQARGSTCVGGNILHVNSCYMYICMYVLYNCGVFIVECRCVMNEYISYYALFIILGKCVSTIYSLCC